MLRNWFDRKGGGVGVPYRCVTRWTSVFLRLVEVEWGVADHLHKLELIVQRVAPFASLNLFFFK